MNNIIECSFCREQYCIRLMDKPLLSCQICGQGAHDPCVLDHLQRQPGEHQSLTASDVWNRINPTNLPGLHYLCEACQKSTIPTEEAGKLKRKSSIKLQSATQGDEQDNRQESTARTSDVQPSPEQDNHEPISLNGDNNVSRIQTGNQQVPGHHQSPSQLPLQQPQQRRVPTQLQPHVVQQPERTTKKVCPFYRKGTCRHGRAGVGCENDHPKACKKLLQHGNKAPHGCTLGRANCDKFHPRMCATSMSKGICFNVDCKLSHVAGTKRSQTEQYSNQGRVKNPTSSKDTTNKNNGTPKDFLDALRLLREEIMEAMDQKLEILLSNQIHATTVRPPGLSMQPPGQHAAMQTGTPLTSISGYPPVGQMGVGGTPQPLILPFSQTGIGQYMNTMYLPTHPAGQAGRAPPMYMQVVPTAMDR